MGAGMEPTCDLRRDAAAVRVGAGLKTSDKGVYAKGIILVVVNSEQALWVSSSGARRLLGTGYGR